MTAAVFVSPLVCKSKKKKERLECKRRTQRVIGIGYSCPSGIDRRTSGSSSVTRMILLGRRNGRARSIFVGFSISLWACASDDVWIEVYNETGSGIIQNHGYQSNPLLVFASSSCLWVADRPMAKFTGRWRKQTIRMDWKCDGWMNGNRSSWREEGLNRLGCLGSDG